MRRILLACIASLALYTLAFAFILDRPLTLGMLRERIEANLAAGAAINGPKLVILAGSNGPYSHRCAIIGPLIGRPCINGGVAVGIGLDYLFQRWQPLLQPGDMVYLPLEEAQYVRPSASAALGPDAVIMLRHDRASLWSMPVHRQVAAVFSSNLRAAVMSLLETALVLGSFHDPRTEAIGSSNECGDHVGHTLALAAVNSAALRSEQPVHPPAAQVEAGYGTQQVRAFLRWAATHQVQVIGGLPTGFADAPPPEQTLAAIRAIYRDEAAWFLELSNRSRYARSAFFDSPDHLHEPAQILHSRAVALALRPMMAAASSERQPSAVHLATSETRLIPAPTRWPNRPAAACPRSGCARD